MKDKKNKKRKKDKDSDAEDDPNAPLLEPEKIEDIKEGFVSGVTLNQEKPAEAESPQVEERTAGPYATTEETKK